MNGNFLLKGNLNEIFVALVSLTLVAIYPIMIILLFFVHNEALFKTIAIMWAVGLNGLGALFVFGTLFGGVKGIFPLTPLELMDSKKRQVITSLPPAAAYDLCMNSLLVRSAELQEENPRNGRISAIVSAETGIVFHISQRPDKKTEIAIEGWIAKSPLLQIGDDLFKREALTRNVIHVLDDLNNYLVTNIADIPLESVSRGMEIPRVGKNEHLAAFLSGVCPGLGAVYCGQFNRGLIVLALTAMGIIFYAIPAIIFWLIGIFDAYSLAKKVNARIIPYVEIKWWVLLIFMIAAFPVFFYSVLGFVMLVFGQSGYHMMELFFYG